MLLGYYLDVHAACLFTAPATLARKARIAAHRSRSERYTSRDAASGVRLRNKTDKTSASLASLVCLVRAQARLLSAEAGEEIWLLTAMVRLSQYERKKAEKALRPRKRVALIDK